jgi:hypothetical protein
VPAKLENLQCSEVELLEQSPFGDGRAAVRIVDVVARSLS